MYFCAPYFNYTHWLSSTPFFFFKPHSAFLPVDLSLTAWIFPAITNFSLPIRFIKWPKTWWLSSPDLGNQMLVSLASCLQYVDSGLLCRDLWKISVLCRDDISVISFFLLSLVSLKDYQHCTPDTSNKCSDIFPPPPPHILSLVSMAHRCMSGVKMLKFVSRRSFTKCYSCVLCLDYLLL